MVTGIFLLYLHILPTAILPAYGDTTTEVKETAKLQTLARDCYKKGIRPKICAAKLKNICQAEHPEDDCKKMLSKVTFYKTGEGRANKINQKVDPETVPAQTIGVE